MLSDQEQNQLILFLEDNKDVLHLYTNDIVDENMKSLVKDYYILVEADDKKILRTKDENTKLKNYKLKISEINKEIANIDDKIKEKEDQKKEMESIIAGLLKGQRHPTETLRSAVDKYNSAEKSLSGEKSARRLMDYQKLRSQRRSRTESVDPNYEELKNKELIKEYVSTILKYKNLNETTEFDNRMITISTILENSESKSLISQKIELEDKKAKLEKEMGELPGVRKSLKNFLKDTAWNTLTKGIPYVVKGAILGIALKSIIQLGSK